jgi:GNAT superfamily N-acetyltransferase
MLATVESFIACRAELEPVLPVHYRELALHQDAIPLVVDWDGYQRLEDDGILFFVTLRDAGVLVGYYIGFISHHMHYMTCTMCMTDIFYVLPECRLNGGGSVLFDAVERELINRGVQKWVVSYKDHLHAGAFLDKHGLHLIEHVHSKMLGG